METNTSVRIGGLTLKNPVTVASGTAAYGEELSRFIDIGSLGAVFTKGLNLEPREGNAGNRVIETPSGLLNSIGLENVGLKEFLDYKLPFLLAKNATVIPNIAGRSEDENVELCSVLSNTHGIEALELNVSCPNVKEGGIAFGTNIDIFTKLLEKTRKAAKGTLIVKLSPNVTDIASFALRAEKIGIDAISAVNTFLGMKIDVRTKKPHFLNKTAGLSGPAIRPLAVHAVYQIYERVKIPIIGEGGISSFDDMLEFMFAGAAAISVGTMNFVEPTLSQSLTGKFEEYLKQNNLGSAEEITGAAH